MQERLYQVAHKKINALLNEVEKVIVGKRPIIQLALTALLAEGHVLFEDIPGVGKTMLAKTLAKGIQGEVKRVQFTPDLLPGDILGVSVYDRQSAEFKFKPGPIFTDVLLGDEINRTTPRSQAALLEAMSEQQVTIDGATYPLSPLFFVMATQNPSSFEGTYPLPEAQLDRFLFCLSIGYPSLQEEVALMTSNNRQKHLANVQGVVSRQDIQEIRQLVKEVYIDERLVEYAAKLVRETRMHPSIRLGISPRGGLALIEGAKAYAVTEGRSFCLPDDIKHVLEPVFGHRLMLKDGSRRGSPNQIKVLAEIQSLVPIPVRSR